MNILSISRSFSKAAREKGMLSAFGMLWRRVGVRYHEQVLRIRTEGALQLPESGIRNPDCHDYLPTEYDAFRVIMRELAIAA